MPIQSRFMPLPTAALSRPPRKPETKCQATLADRALSVFSDLRYSAIVTADHLDPLSRTAELLLKAGTHMGFVTDVHGQIIGMVSAEQLSGERPLQRAMAANVRHDELTLEDLMTPISDWATIDAGELAHARVGDIVETLHATGQRYLFVTERIDAETYLRGMFSARRIEEALESPISADGHAHSFAELESLLGR
jgi:CBS domain containing-hemolysin-like protein